MSFILKSVGWLAENFIGSLIEKVAEFAVQQIWVDRDDQDDLDQLKRSLLSTRVIISTVENMRIKDEILKKRLQDLLLQLKDAAYDADDLLDEFRYRFLQQQIEQKGQEASKISSSSFSSSNILPSKKMKTSVVSSVATRFFGRADDDVLRLREINGRLDSITTDLKEVTSFLEVDDKKTKQTVSSEGRKTSSISVETEVFGREKELSGLMESLLKSVDASEFSNGKVSILTITGIGGVGKTTLAQQAYNDKRVEEHFQLKAWVSVSENFSVERLTKEIIESGTRERCDLISFDALQVGLKEKIASRRFLLVLDDVWNEDKHKWESLCSPLRSGVPGSKIVVTTRSTKIAEMVGNMGAIHLDVLDEENSWKFFRKCSFGSHNSCDHPRLEAIAKKIVPKLKGLPLAARTIGGLLNAKMDEKHWKTVMTSEIWQLPQDENGVLPVLQLSYQFLPAHLKKCFAFCSLFPKDYYFDEHMLIGIWMAQGFIAAEGSVRMEDVGATYFNDLVSRSFFQSAHYGAYVMHDLMHDLAELISAGDSYRIDVGKSQEVPKILRHLSIYPTVEPRWLTKFLGYNKLWTLILVRVPQCYMNCMYGSFQRLKSIRALVLTDFATKELPESIGNLIHLRYLEVSSHRIKMLPESLCGLYNLQTLIVRECHSLEGLPQGMTKLINLRRLYTTDEMISDIVEVGKLTSLQELSAFKASKNPRHKLAELSELTQLHGRLRIMNLENVESREEASNAMLKGKKDLDELVLEWAPVKDSNLEKNDSRIFEEVLEGLQPHHTISHLAIKEYNGARPPSWLDAKALSNLETLTLENCKRWEDISLILQLPHVKCLHVKGMPIEKRISHNLFGPGSSKCMFFSGIEELLLEDLPLLEELPNLGQIPRLKVLRIGGMPAVKRIGHGFRRLEKLRLSNMPALEEWSGPEGKELFPCLCELQIQQCPQLKRLPPLPPSLTRLSLSKIGLTELPRLQNVIHGSNNNMLVSSQINNCPNLTNVDRAEQFICSRDLDISSCPLTELPILYEQMDGSSSKIAVSLSELYISSCPNLTSLEQGLLSYHLPNLQSIYIESCGELLWIPIKRFKELTALERLLIRNCPKLRRRAQDEYLHLPTSIDSLVLSNCGDLSISLPDCSHNLASLRSLVISLCPNMEALPIRPYVHLRHLTLGDCKELQSIDGLCVKSLMQLKITGCPKLLLPSEREEQRASSSLRYLDIDDTALLRLLPLKNALTSVKHLAISSSSQMVMFEGEEQGLLLNLTDLKGLTFRACKNLQSLPAQLHTVSSLEFLHIFDCPHIESLPQKGLPMSLTGLSFRGCHPKLTEELKKSKAEMRSSGRFLAIHSI